MLTLRMVLLLWGVTGVMWLLNALFFFSFHLLVDEKPKLSGSHLTVLGRDSFVH